MKLFSDLYPVKFLDTSNKVVFSVQKLSLRSPVKRASRRLRYENRAHSNRLVIDC